MAVIVVSQRLLENVGFPQQSLVISHVRRRVPCMKAAQSSLVCDTYPTRVRDPGPNKMVAHAASDKNRLPPSRAIILSYRTYWLRDSAGVGAGGSACC